MKRFSFISFFLIGIFIFALWNRTVNLAGNPPSISWDEASIGYNAYSILKTGKDEHGTFLPLDTFAAFGDYKPPVPVYLTVPFVALLGLTEVAVRLPSALAGSLTVLVLYFLVTELFYNHKHSLWLGCIAAGLLSVTPWHIMLSRAGFEANIALLFITLGIWWVLLAKRNPNWLYVCWLPFVIGVYTFNSARYAGPIIAAGLLVLVGKQMWSHKRLCIIGIAIALVTLLPIMPHLLSPQSRLRFDEVSIFTDLNVVLTANTRQRTDGNVWWAKILDNRRVSYIHDYLVHFTDNIQPRFLFMTGDGNPKFSIQDAGELLLVTAPVLLYGILTLVTEYPVVSVFLIWWLLASIAPAAVARETPHALRVENGLPVYLIFTAYGILSLIDMVRGEAMKRIVVIITVLLVVFNFVYFWHNLTTHYPTEFSGEWQYGYRQAIAYADTVSNTYDTIVLSESIGRPYIYVLFYDRVDPQVFWAEKDASFDAAGFYNVYGFGKYRFVKDTIGRVNGRVLYILDPAQVPPNAHILKTIRVLNGTPILTIFNL